MEGGSCKVCGDLVEQSGCPDCERRFEREEEEEEKIDETEKRGRKKVLREEIKTMIRSVHSLYHKKEGLVAQITAKHNLSPSLDPLESLEQEKEGRDKQSDVPKVATTIRHLEKRKEELEKRMKTLKDKKDALDRERERLLSFQKEQSAMLMLEDELKAKLQLSESRLEDEFQLLFSLRRVKLSLLSDLFQLGPLPSPPPPPSSSSSSSSSSPKDGQREGEEEGKESTMKSSSSFCIVNIILKPDDHFAGLFLSLPFSLLLSFLLIFFSITT